MSKLDIRALRKALRKTFKNISVGSRTMSPSDNIEKKIKEALGGLNEEYKKEAGEHPDIDDIDFDKVNITKENE